MAALRNTIQRDLVLQAVRDLKNHPTPEEVYEYIHKKHPTISKGTVYRNLNVLVEQGQLYRVSMPDSANRVDHTLTPHYHFACRICKTVEDVDLPYMEGIMEKEIRNLEGFEVEGHELIFSGVCPACREKRKETKEMKGETA